jgi:hypothetical protein
LCERAARDQRGDARDEEVAHGIRLASHVKSSRASED